MTILLFVSTLVTLFLGFIVVWAILNPECPKCGWRLKNNTYGELECPRCEWREKI